jgi:hypothetical protein
LCFSFHSVAHHRTGGDGGFLKDRPGRLDKPDLLHAALQVNDVQPPFSIGAV